jgi:ureidoglycolate lyase
MAAEATLLAQPLTAAGFAPFGTVNAPPADASGGQAINADTTQRFELVAPLDLQRAGGHGVLALYRSQPRSVPMQLLEMERHSLGMQMFMPLHGQRFVVVVAAPGDTCPATALQAFVTDGSQGVLLAAGTWHHPLLALDGGDYLVLERRSAVVDCEVLPLPAPVLLMLAA